MYFEMCCYFFILVVELSEVKALSLYNRLCNCEKHETKRIRVILSVKQENISLGNILSYVH